MKTIVENMKRCLSLILLAGAVSLPGCSNQDNTNQSDKTKSATATQADSATETSTGATTQTQAPVGARAAPAEMALVVQNYGMAKFSELKRLNDLGYALFSIFPDGRITSGASANLTNYEVDWSAAKLKRYGAQDISLRLPSIKDRNNGQVVASQSITISRVLEKKLKLKTPESLSVIFTIETLVSDSARTICALGISTP